MPNPPPALLPKAELHVHLNGTVTPALRGLLIDRHVERRVAQGQNAADVKKALNDKFAGRLDKHGALIYRDFTTFHDTYSALSDLCETDADLYLLASDYLARCHAQGAIYVELMTSAVLRGQEPAQHLAPNVAAISRAIREAEETLGITARLQITAKRHMDAGRTAALVDALVALKDPYVCGFGLAGDEAQYPVENFVELYAKAARAGLGLTIHSGEVGDAQAVRRTIEALGPLGLKRIDHGFRAAEDASVMFRLVEKGVVLTICPSSNHQMRLTENYTERAFKTLHAAGVRLTVNTDNPGLFGTDIAGEYEIARRVYGLSAYERLALTANAIASAFVTEDVRAQLGQKLRSMAVAYMEQDGT